MRSWRWSFRVSTKLRAADLVDSGCSPHRLDDLELGVLDHDLVIQSSKDLVEVCEVPEEILDLMEADGDRLVPPRTSWNDFVEKRSMIEDEKVIMVLVDEIQDGSNVQILAVLVLTFRSDSRVECSEKYIRHKFPQSPVLGDIVAPRDRLSGFGDSWFSFALPLPTTRR